MVSNSPRALSPEVLAVDADEIDRVAEDGRELFEPLEVASDLEPDELLHVIMLCGEHAEPVGSVSDHRRPDAHPLPEEERLPGRSQAIGSRSEEVESSRRYRFQILRLHLGE